MSKAGQDWPELAAGLYDKLTGRNAEITYEFSDFDLNVPSHVGPEAVHTTWRLNGSLSIRTQERGAHG